MEYNYVLDDLEPNVGDFGPNVVISDVKSLQDPMFDDGVSKPEEVQPLIEFTNKETVSNDKAKESLTSNKIGNSLNAEHSNNGDGITTRSDRDELTNRSDVLDNLNDNGNNLKKNVHENDVHSEKFDISKVKSEVMDEGEALDNKDHKLVAKGDEEIDNDDSHSTEGNKRIEKSDNDTGTTSRENDKLNIKQEPNSDTKVIVLNKHNKFNSRFKPDPSLLRHACDKCEEAFRFPHQLALHKRAKHEGKYSYHCKVCKKPFEKSSALKDHMYVHTESRPFMCKLCDKGFKMNGSLRKHMRDIHLKVDGPVLNFQCEYCSKIFPTKERLTSHFIVHDNNKPFECNICGKCFSRKSNLKEHTIIHSTEKNFVCPDCGMRFNRKYSLKIHARNHMAVKPYKCELCPESFSQLHALKTHFRLHTGEKPFKCNVCEKSFRQLATLQVHLRRHSGVKDFKCDICSRAFVIKRRLIEHRRCHTGEKPFACDLCPHRTATSSGLRLHKKTHARQMQRQAQQKAEGIISEINCKRQIKRKKELNSLNISTKFLKKKVVKTRNDMANDGDEEGNDYVESVNERETFEDVEADFENVVTDSYEAPENLTTDSLIEIVNDIEDAELYSSGANVEVENVNDEIQDNISVEPEVQVSKEPEKRKRRRVTNKTARKVSKAVEEDFKTVTKEMLYKHLNEFIPAIDADVLAEKIDFITEELLEVHERLSPSQKPNQVNSLISKKPQISKSVNQNSSILGSMNGDNVSVRNSGQTMFFQSLSTGLESSVDYSSQTMVKEIPKKKRAKQPVVTNTVNTPTANGNTGMIRQLLSTRTSQTLQPVLSVADISDGRNQVANNVTNFLGHPESLGMQNSNQSQSNAEKMFYSQTLRNMLVNKTPDKVTKEQVSMVTRDVSIKQEPLPPAPSTPTGSSTVLRNMLSTPPKHYLISTKNSYAAMLRSIARQTEENVASKNAFHGMWRSVDESPSGSSEFPWVEEKTAESLPAPDMNFMNVKIEPMSP